MASDLEWPHGLCREIALLDIEQSEIERIASVEFHRDYDDLDSYIYTIITLGDYPYAVQRYNGYPGNGLTLMSMDNAQNSSDQIDYFLSSFGLSRSILIWTTPL